MLNIEKEISDIKFVEFLIAITLVFVIFSLLQTPSKAPLQNNTVDTVYIGYNDSLLNTIDSLQNQINDNRNKRIWNYNSLKKKIVEIDK